MRYVLILEDGREYPITSSTDGHTPVTLPRVGEEVVLEGTPYRVTRVSHPLLTAWRGSDIQAGFTRVYVIAWG